MGGVGSELEATRIQPYTENPAYWQYRGKPVLLLGGSVEDNLFQLTGDELTRELDTISAAGGNYVRCTMSSRDEGNVWPFEKDAGTGLYDLDKPGSEFWRRFEDFLRGTSSRGIIVQVEVWATFDYYRDCWDNNPFNPKNNSNYTAAESGLPEVVATHPTKTENDFFWSVPGENNQEIVLNYQHAFVDKLLSISLAYPNVLYCMDNETSVTPRWGAYWSEYIKAKAAEAGVGVETTEMWDPWDLSHEMHSNTFDHPETYSFVDISQNNHQKGQAHWDNAQKQRLRVSASGNIRPLSNVKVYGADTGRFGSSRDGKERFWRNIIGGAASTRFHRCPSGLGITETAQRHVKSLRMLTDAVDMFRCLPANDLLSDRADNEAYCTARAGVEYALFFPDGGEVVLDCSAVEAGKALTLRWLNIEAAEWAEARKEIPSEGALALVAPGEGYWAVLVKRGA